MPPAGNGSNLLERLDTLGDRFQRSDVVVHLRGCAMELLPKDQDRLG
jgi:hypothetical protein